MRRAAKVDRNQAEIVAALRAVGATVVSLAPCGDGVPDLLVGHGGLNYLIEVKDGERIPSERKLTPDQVKWFDEWNGQAGVAENIEQALAIIQVKQ